jgi:hypothetical protein
VLAFCRIVTGLGQGKVKGREQSAVEKECPLREGGLEDGIQRPWVVPVASRLANACAGSHVGRVSWEGQAWRVTTPNVKTVQAAELLTTTCGLRSDW